MKTEIFIERSNILYKNEYDYSLVKYVNARSKIDIICKKLNHGVFSKTPDKHLRGQGCPKCSNQKLSLQNRKSSESFISQSHEIHGDKYIYDRVIYKNNVSPIDIECRKHGLFSQKPTVHLKGHGCLRCGTEHATIKTKKSLSKFICNSRKIHGEKYDYKLVEYINSFRKINIICFKHDVFQQTPHDHLSGYGCPKCGHRISKGEKEWLDFMNIKQRQIAIQLFETTKIVDGYDDKSKTVYEYYGDFWHGNPLIYNPNEINPRSKLSMGELFNNTKKAEILLQTSGYNIITMWEKDWKEMRKKL
jgi:Zn finger protein HypA/HybF involved in hydrogenase expression